MQDATDTFINMLQEDNHSADKERPMRISIRMKQHKVI